MCEDEQSKKEYLGIIKFRQTLEENDFPDLVEEGKAYFIKEMLLGKDEVYIDCGASNGDTIDSFLKCSPDFKQIIAFEPSTRLFPQLKEKYGNHPKITLINAGVFDEDALSRLGQKSWGSTRLIGVHATILNAHDDDYGPDEILEVQVKAIDNLSFTNKVTLIKMDIEGAELNALKGAKETILRDKPKLAICIYHSERDMIEIAEYIHELVPEYKFYVRHHASYPYIIETVLYAAS